MTEIQDLLVTDAMAEAGRKIFAEQLRIMQKHEDGSRTGDDIESVHQMRVATRKMRSLFKLIGEHYKPKTVAKYSSGLRDIARALGQIRDLDVIIEDLEDFCSKQSPETQAPVETIIQKFDKQRNKHRASINKMLDSDKYKKFVRQFSKFAHKQGRGAVDIISEEVPHQVRHVLPIILHQRLAIVRAYETVLPAAEDEVLHALRVEFKQLRYAVEFFKPVLGTSAEAYIKEVKAMQDLLGRINDIAVFSERIQSVRRLNDDQKVVVALYLETRNAELDILREQFDEQWQSFNQRTVQRQFSDALLVLR